MKPPTGGRECAQLLDAPVAVAGEDRSIDDYGDRTP